MTPARYLVDTSALVRLLRDADVREQWETEVTAGLVAVCPLIELEMLYTARSKADRDELRELLRTAFGWVAMPERLFEHALEVQAALTNRGTHRSAGAVDLMVAATAHLHRLVLLHYDRDFDCVGEVTGQPTQWARRPGAAQ